MCHWVVNPACFPLGLPIARLLTVLRQWTDQYLVIRVYSEIGVTVEEEWAINRTQKSKEA
jgi:hypothetical protein